MLREGGREGGRDRGCRGGKMLREGGREEQLQEQQQEL